MKVSLVVPMKNEESLISDFFNNLKRQTHVPEEIIVVDNNSDDRTVELVEEWRGRMRDAGSSLVVLHCVHGHQAEARAVGCRTAKHPIIVFADADTIVNDEWVAEAVKLFEEDEGLVGAGGPMFYRHRFMSGLHLLGFLFYKLLPSTFAFYGSNAAFRRSAYEQTGGLRDYRVVADARRYSEPFDDVFLSAQLKRVGKVLPFYHLRATGLYRVGGNEVHILTQLVRQMKQTTQTLLFYRAAKRFAESQDA